VKAKRTFELCYLDDDGEIEECEVIDEDALPNILSIEQASRVLNDPLASQLFFGNRAGTADEVGEVENVFTLAEWRMCLDDETCELPKDVLLKAMGPDAEKILESQAKERVEGVSDAEAAIAATQSSKEDSRFHLHFGAGRLGMGLVVPSISASGVPFAVVQRPKPKWQSLFKQQTLNTKSDELGVSVNTQVVVHNVEVIKSQEGTPNFMPPQSLIFGNTPEELQPAVDRATSFSCSLGPAMADVLVPLLETLPEVPRDEQPHLFCCENDHDAVMSLKTTLEGKVFVIDCMVDRVCTGRTITTEGVDVSAEPWRGSIVVLEPNLKGRLPFCSRVATAPRSAREAEYLSERKFSLVNGMHTVVAFMTLQDNWVEDDGGREYVLLKYTKMRRASQRMCEAWRTARAAQLIDKFGLASLMEWHGKETAEGAWEVLLTYGDDVLEARFSMTDDVVSRVLGGGVANRWLTRLRPTDTWMEERVQGGVVDELTPFFAYALARDRNRALERGCDVEDSEWRGCDVEEPEDVAADSEALLSTYLASLTSNSRQFCTKEAAITHKELIKEQRKAGGKALAPKVERAMQSQKGKGI